MEGLLLGLSSGTICLAYCAPVLIPYMMGKSSSTAKNFTYLGLFLLGRLAGYLLFAAAAFMTGWLLLGNAACKEMILGVVYLILAVCMFFYGINKQQHACTIKPVLSGAGALFRDKERMMPAFLGLLTGINLCPPFLLAFTGASNSKSLAGSLLFFSLFFVGTAVYFLPTPLIGAFRSYPALRMTGRMVCVLMSLYYVYSGIMKLAGGMYL